MSLQVSFPISYKGKFLGEYAADLVVDEKVIVELKCVDRFARSPRWNGNESSWIANFVH